MTSTLAHTSSLRKLFPRMWQGFICAWLAFLIGPIASELGDDFRAGHVLALLIWAVAFATVWLWIMLRNPFRGTGPSPVEQQLQLGLLVALAALALYFNLVYGPGLSWIFIYVHFAAAAILPTRRAIPAIILIALMVGAIDVATGREIDAITQVPGGAVYGFAIVIVRRLVVTVNELETARAEIAQLSASEAIAAERLRFARDLHDLLGHSLSVIALKSELAGRLLPTDCNRAAVEIADVQRVARQALREVREVVAGYRRPSLSAELDAARKLLSSAGIEATIAVDGEPFPPVIDALLAWAVREGTTNVVRHSHAHRCDIRLWRDRDMVYAEIRDDGKGLESEQPEEPTGFGLAGLTERIAAHGGDLLAEPQASGFVLRVTLPLPARAHLDESCP